MRVGAFGIVFSVVVGSTALVGLSPGTAHAAATTVGTSKLGVFAYAGGNNDADYKESFDHDGNKSLTGSDSDTGPDGTASATGTMASTASATKVTISGSGSTSSTGQADAGFYPGSVLLTTTLGESGQWVWAGAFDVTASSVTPDGCINGSVSVYVYPPGETDPDYIDSASVTSCTNGAAHKTFGNLNSVGAPLEAGSRIKVSASLSSPSSFATGTSDATFSVEVRKKVAPVSNTAAPSLFGTGIVGSALSTTTGSWNGGPTTFTYQWRSDGADVPGATGWTYVVRPEDVGRLIQCHVTASNGTSTSSQLSSGVIGRVEAAPPAPPVAPPVALASTASPTVSGKFVVGKKLTSTTGAWSQNPSSVRYQWLRNGKPIGGATGSTYKLAGKDEGRKVSVQVTVGAPNHLDGTATSAAKKVKPRPQR